MGNCRNTHAGYSYKYNTRNPFFPVHRVMEYTVVRIAFTRSYGRGEGKVEEQPPQKPANSQLMGDQRDNVEDATHAIFSCALPISSQL